MKKLEAICVIPAKARSTRFPDKNVADLAGEPLVTRAVEVARQSGACDVVMVSTDAEAISQLASDSGAEVPFSRDQSLTEDTVEVGAVVRHALEWYQHEGDMHFEWVCILQPTSPLRTAADIVAARKLLADDPQADAVVSVSKYHHHPYWALRLEGGCLTPDVPDGMTKSRQHLPDLYHPDGVVYWRRAADFLAGKDPYQGKILAYLTPLASALDIDYPQDLQYAQWLLAERQKVRHTTR